MKTIKIDELKEKKYKEIMDELTSELAQTVENAAAEIGVREDVLMTLKELNGSIEGVLLYDFLIDHFYGAEWYELFGKILKEKENGASYLEILKEVSAKKKLSVADVAQVYRNTDSEYGFQRVLEQLQNADEKANELSEQKKKGSEKASVPTADSVYENFYQEVIETEKTTEQMDQHDQLVAAVIKVNNEYKDMKNKLKEMERMAHIQNRILAQYKENIANIQKEDEELKTVYEKLQKENAELKKKYNSAISRLVEINNFTAGNSSDKLLS